MSRLRCLIVACFLVGISACTRAGDNGKTGPPVSWDEKFKEDKHLILTAPWQKAEDAYEDLSEQVATPDEMRLWIEFQIEILDETESDPLKDEIRMSAASILQDYPDLVSPYIGHLETGLATNKYKEAEVRNWIKFAIEKSRQHDKRR